ncbi:hypothetical protein [Thalassolituus sp. UBA2009]|uniref:hypothetical protein n=1 Tax=Thalassolituus sp. UBA2009 TaxID=1947658 RepID=UPI002579D1F7|nr:hypothetical protein [Thalassolituus sp. UBA2009]
MDNFQQRIQLLIDRHGRKALSEATGISTTQLHRLRTGSDTTRENLIRLSDATGTEFLWLGKGEGPMYSDGTPAPTMPTAPAPEFSKDEIEIVELFRKADLSLKLQVFQLLKGGSPHQGGISAAGHGTNIVSSGDGSIAAAGNVKKGSDQ